MDQKRLQELACKAFGSDDLATIEKLLRQGLDPGGAVPCHRNLSNWPLLVLALDEDAPCCALALLAAGADPDAPNPDGVRAVHVAASLRGPLLQSGLEFLSKCIAKGCDLNVADMRAATPLHWACGWRNFEALELLLASGADPNAGGPEFETPMHELLRAGGFSWQHEALRLAIDCGGRLENPPCGPGSPDLLDLDFWALENNCSDALAFARSRIEQKTLQKACPGAGAGAGAAPKRI